MAFKNGRKETFFNEKMKEKTLELKNGDLYRKFVAKFFSSFSHWLFLLKCKPWISHRRLDFNRQNSLVKLKDSQNRQFDKVLKKINWKRNISTNSPKSFSHRGKIFSFFCSVAKNDLIFSVRTNARSIANCNYLESFGVPQ